MSVYMLDHDFLQSLSTQTALTILSAVFIRVAGISTNVLITRRVAANPASTPRIEPRADGRWHRQKGDGEIVG